MQELFNRYVDYLEAEKNASPYTVRNYTTDILGSDTITGFLAFLRERGVETLEGADRHHMRAYMAYLMQQGLVKASIARRLSAIRSFCRYLVREGILKVNPVQETSSPKLDKRLPEFLTQDETARLLAAPDPATPRGRRDRAFLELLYATGLRVSELVGLNLDQIDFETREIRVIGKGSKERIALMGEPAAKALSTYLTDGRGKPLAAQPKQNDVSVRAIMSSRRAGKAGNKNNAVFLNYRGGRLTERSVQGILNGYARAVGIERNVHPHMLRHTFATHMLDGGADLRVVQELLGHSSLSTTQIYTHVSKTQAKRVYLASHPMAKE